MDPTAPVDSVEPGDVFATVFRTMPGDPLSKPYTPVTFDLTRFAGQTVRLRYAEVDNQSWFLASVDVVDIESVGPPPPLRLHLHLRRHRLHRRLRPTATSAASTTAATASTPPPPPPPPPPPARCRVPRVIGLRLARRSEDPRQALLSRTHPPSRLEATGPRHRPEPKGGRLQAPRLPGQARRGPALALNRAQKLGPAAYCFNKDACVRGEARISAGSACDGSVVAAIGLHPVGATKGGIAPPPERLRQVTAAGRDPPERRLRQSARQAAIRSRPLRNIVAEAGRAREREPRAKRGTAAASGPELDGRETGAQTSASGARSRRPSSPSTASTTSAACFRPTRTETSGRPTTCSGSTCSSRSTTRTARRALQAPRPGNTLFTGLACLRTHEQRRPGRRSTTSSPAAGRLASSRPGAAVLPVRRRLDVERPDGHLVRVRVQRPHHQVQRLPEDGRLADPERVHDDREPVPRHGLRRRRASGASSATR